MENQSLNWLERINEFLSRSVTVKLITVTVIILLLLIPKSMISSLIVERENNMKQVSDEISGIWSGSQVVSGPVLVIPCIRTATDENGKAVTVRENAYFLPEQLDINCNVMPEKRSRGLYSVIVYKSEITLNGRFGVPDSKSLALNDKELLFDQAKLQIGISDLRGIGNSVLLNWNNTGIEFNPGSTDKNLFNTGITAPVTGQSGNDFAKEYSIKIDLKGSEYLYFMPLGKETTARMSSSWNSPSFTGSFLPASQEVTDHGFTASWKVLDYNRNYPQQWLDGNQSFDNSQFGVHLLIAADHYQKTFRSAKYSILVVCLTFLAFILVEMISRKRIHPVQYTLIGLALILFYVLLLSASEYLGFDWAYLISAIMIVALITFYSRTIFDDPRSNFLMPAYLVVIYGFIYIILQLENYSLLVGSLGLFIALAVTMYVTRKIKWYGDRTVT